MALLLFFLAFCLQMPYAFGMGPRGTRPSNVGRPLPPLPNSPTKIVANKSTHALSLLRLRLLALAHMVGKESAVPGPINPKDLPPPPKLPTKEDLEKIAKLPIPPPPGSAAEAGGRIQRPQKIDASQPTGLLAAIRAGMKLKKAEIINKEKPLTDLEKNILRRRALLREEEENDDDGWEEID